MEPADPYLSGRALSLPVVVARTRYDCDLPDLIPAALEEREHIPAREEAKVGLIQEPSGLVGPIALQQGGDDAVVAHVRDAGNQHSVGSQPAPRPAQERLRVEEMLQHVSADNAIERRGRKARLDP